jgi:dCMP deaminase
MKKELLEIRKQQCRALASASPCSRRTVGALILDPLTNAIISDGYNGTPRKSLLKLCGGNVCLRTKLSIKSGTQSDLGCHHAEMNAILNASRAGIQTLNKWLLTSCDPCLMCAKAIHHAGIIRVYAPQEQTQMAGLHYLAEQGIEIKKF